MGGDDDAKNPNLRPLLHHGASRPGHACDPPPTSHLERRDAGRMCAPRGGVMASAPMEGPQRSHTYRGCWIPARAGPPWDLAPPFGRPAGSLCGLVVRHDTQSVGTEMAFFLLNRLELIAVTPLICHGGLRFRLSSSSRGMPAGDVGCLDVCRCRDSRTMRVLARGFLLERRRALSGTGKPETSGVTKLLCYCGVEGIMAGVFSPTRSPGSWPSPFCHILAAPAYMSADTRRGFASYENMPCARDAAGRMNIRVLTQRCGVPLQAPLRGPLPVGGSRGILVVERRG